MSTGFIDHADRTAQEPLPMFRMLRYLPFVLMAWRYLKRSRQRPVRRGGYR